jgi:hypothetical protein
MTLDTMIMLAGALTAVLPFLGFPNSWDNVLFFLTGVFVIALGIMVRRRGDRPVERPRQTPQHFDERLPEERV